jgi:hypothetical protein
MFFKRFLRPLLIASGLVSTALFASLAAQTPQTRLASRQLIWPLESRTVFVNGTIQQSALPLKSVDGRALVPLRELSRLMDLPLEALPTGLRFGKLDVYPALKLARVDGKQVALADVGAVIEGNTYIAVKVLESAVSATVIFDGLQRIVAITVSKDRPAGLRLPVARFGTDKREYRLGEPVRIVEYSYDPDGLAIVYLRYTGREDAFFTPGLKTITLVATNALGRASEAYSVQIRVTSDVMYSPKGYALRFTPIGKTFQDNDVLNYPSFTPSRIDDATPLLVSDSPEEPDRSGLLYSDTIEGSARLVAYHINPLQTLGRVLVLISNLEPNPTEVRAVRFGETSGTQIAGLLGQVSLLDFLTSPGGERLRLEPGQSAPLYVSAPLDQGQGVNVKFDLETTGRVTLSTYFLEDGTFNPDLTQATPEALLNGLLELPVLDVDTNHVRGTFPGAVRRLRLDLSQLQPGAATRLIIGDNQADPALTGRDVIGDRAVTLLGNYSMSYKITLENATGTVGALVPRGGPYSGAIRVGNTYLSVPDSGVLFRNDLPFVVYRAIHATADGRVELEFVPASGSFLPVNLLFYRLESPDSARAKSTPQAVIPSRQVNLPAAQPPR